MLYRRKIKKSLNWICIVKGSFFFLLFQFFLCFILFVCMSFFISFNQFNFYSVYKFFNLVIALIAFYLSFILWVKRLCIFINETLACLINERTSSYEVQSWSRIVQDPVLNYQYTVYVEIFYLFNKHPWL